MNYWGAQQMSKQKSIHTNVQWKYAGLYGGCTMLLLIAIVLAVSIGPVTIPFTETVTIFLEAIGMDVGGGLSEKNQVIIMDIRLPRVLVAGLVGAALAISGVAMQGLFRNPLIEPGFIGISSGAACGAVAAIFFGWTATSVWALPFAAFIGALLAMALILLIWQFAPVKQIATLLLLGIGINAFFSSVANVFIASASTEQELRGALLWLQGGLEGRSWEHVYIIVPIVAIGSIVICLFARSLNMMLLGEEHAFTSGVRLTVMRYGILLIVALITGAAVAVSGIISFVGLVVPHMLRLLIGHDHKILLPTSMFIGATFLICMDLISRIILQPITLQVGVVAALVGAPVFLFLLFKSNRGVFTA